jgi:hypothetical protein
MLESLKSSVADVQRGPVNPIGNAADSNKLRQKFVQRGAASFVAQLRDTKDNAGLSLPMSVSMSACGGLLVILSLGNRLLWSPPALRFAVTQRVFVRPVFRSTGLFDFDQGDASCGKEAELQNFVHAQVCRGHQSVSRAQGSEWRYRDFIRTSGTTGFRMRSGRDA